MGSAPAPIRRGLKRPRWDRQDRRCARGSAPAPIRRGLKLNAPQRAPSGKLIPSMERQGETSTLVTDGSISATVEEKDSPYEPDHRTFGRTSRGSEGAGRS